MELRHLRYFVAVAEALNFTRAAARLHLTQPALSRQIRDLEQELGCTLLRRGANARTELTPEGRQLLEGARQLLADAERLKQRAREGGARLRVGHYGVLWLDYFSPTLRRFAKRHPQVRLEPVELTPRELVGALRRGEVDLALVGLADDALRREFHAQRVAAYSALLALAATHPLAKRRKLKLAELRGAEWVTWDEREFPGRRQSLVEACRAAGFRPRIVLETDSMASLFVHVATSEAVGHVIPMTRRMPHEGVVFVEIDPPTAFCSEMQVAWRRHDPREGLLRELVAELAATPAAR
jgi:LysR family transcriptional regulator, benzoate and cis,cis-muconate-responsive activator of ben and cat genes